MKKLVLLTLLFTLLLPFSSRAAVCFGVPPIKPVSSCIGGELTVVCNEYTGKFEWICLRKNYSHW